MQNNDGRYADEYIRADHVENTIFSGGQNLILPLEPANSRLNIIENISKVLTNRTSIFGYAIGSLTALGVAIDCMSRDNDSECIKNNIPLVAIPVVAGIGVASSLRVLKNNYPEQYQRIFGGGLTVTLGFVNPESRTFTQPSIQQSTRQGILQPPASITSIVSPRRSEPVQVNANDIGGANVGK